MVKDMFRSTGNTIIAQLISRLFVFLCVAFLYNLLFTIIISLCALFILLGLNINFACSSAKRDVKAAKSNIYKYSWRKVFLIGFSSSLPSLFMWIILLFSYLEIIPNFLTLYKLTNEYFLIITAFMCNVSEASQISISAMIVLFTASLIPFITVCVSYYIMYNRNYKH